MSEVLKSIEYHRRHMQTAMPYSPPWHHHMKAAAKFTKVWRQANSLQGVIVN